MLQTTRCTIKSQFVQRECERSNSVPTVIVNCFSAFLALVDADAVLRTLSPAFAVKLFGTANQTAMRHTGPWGPQHAFQKFAGLLGVLEIGLSASECEGTLLLHLDLIC